MRIMSFSRRWPKLEQDSFTTFRFPRKDAIKGHDWHLGEALQLYYHSRRPDRQYLGDAQIIEKIWRRIDQITEVEAIVDGFQTLEEMLDFLGQPDGKEWINKFTLKKLIRRSGEN